MPLRCKWRQVCFINVRQQWLKDTAPGGPLLQVKKENAKPLPSVVDHIDKVSKPAKSCAAYATGLQSQEQVLM